jgi:hypothetical protein
MFNANDPKKLHVVTKPKKGDQATPPPSLEEVASLAGARPPPQAPLAFLVPRYMA